MFANVEGSSYKGQNLLMTYFPQTLSIEDENKTKQRHGDPVFKHLAF